jgi:predicted DNA-binding transcriptional regulator YafY
LNRWYIVGCYPNKNKLYIFGLDRIKKLELTDCFFLPDPEINALDRFENIVGLVKNDTELEKVVLVFEASQANYIKSLPIHKSQKVVRETKSSCIVELELVPNLEFIQTILMHGSFVKVREPLWLVEEIKETLKEALAQYSS